MTKKVKAVVRYSLSFKQQIVREMEDEGLTNVEVSRRHGPRELFTCGYLSLVKIFC
jgi:transposase-like protein